MTLRERLRDVLHLDDAEATSCLRIVAQYLEEEGEQWRAVGWRHFVQWLRKQ